MKRTEISSIYKTPEAFLNKEVVVCGWVRTLRDSKSLGFIDLNDGSYFKGVQVVIEDQKLDNFKEITKDRYYAIAYLCIDPYVTQWNSNNEPKYYRIMKGSKLNTN